MTVILFEPPHVEMVLITICDRRTLSQACAFAQSCRNILLIARTTKGHGENDSRNLVTWSTIFPQHGLLICSLSVWRWQINITQRESPQSRVNFINTWPCIHTGDTFCRKLKFYECIKGLHVRNKCTLLLTNSLLVSIKASVAQHKNEALDQNALLTPAQQPNPQKLVHARRRAEAEQKVFQVFPVLKLA